MKISDVREGQRVRWRDREGEVLMVQGADVAPDLAAEDCALTAAVCAGYPHPYIITPSGEWDGMPRRGLRALVRLDGVALTDECGRTHTAAPCYLWCTPRALQPEVER